MAPGPEPPLPDEHLSIGRLAAATGISTARLRAWERRYGRPAPVRVPSGHRRYPPAEVHRLRRVVTLLARGHRPGELLALDDAELDRRIAAGADAGPRRPPELDRWLALSADLRAEELHAELLAALAAADVLPFLRERLGPFLAELGNRWARGEVEVRHEHLTTRVIEDVLRERAAALPRPLGSPGPVIVTTLPGERHALGLAMVALLCSARRRRVVDLGPDTPTEEIARTAHEQGAAAVALSVTGASAGPRTSGELVALRRSLPPEVEILVGGAGVLPGERGPRGVRVLGGLDELEAWLAAGGDARGGECARP